MNVMKRATILASAVALSSVVGVTADVGIADAAPKPSGATLFLCPDFEKA